MFVIRNVKPNVAPADPTGIVAQAISATSIRVTWNDNASNEYGYLIERSRTKDGTYMALATTPVNAQEFVDMALRPDTRYYYRVRALSAAGNSHHTGRTSDRTLVPGVSGSLQTNFSEDPLDRYLLLDELA